MVEINNPVQIQVESLKDLLRWLITSSKDQSNTVFYFTQEKNHIFLSYLSLPDYFSFEGLPIIAYCTHKESPSKSFLRFDIRSGTDAEDQLQFVSGFDDSQSSLGYLQYFPVVVLKKIPEIFRIREFE